MKDIIEKNIIFRSCWNCNEAHEHLKEADYVIWCFLCEKFYFKGEEICLKR